MLNPKQEVNSLKTCGHISQIHKKFLYRRGTFAKLPAMWFLTLLISIGRYPPFRSLSNLVLAYESPPDSYSRQRVEGVTSVFLEPTTHLFSVIAPH